MRVFRKLLTFALLLVSITPGFAKRLAPKAVPPVVVASVEYSAPSTAMGFVVATDTRTGKELWRERIYTIPINPALERDVQDVFIVSIAFEGGLLVITDERGKSYALDPATRKVTSRK